MPKKRTHYDNLKVAQDAPHEVIRAAYKVLSQKHHPDRNGSSDESLRVMKIINQSYEVLSNEESRGKHDQWIEEQSPQAETKSNETKRKAWTKNQPPGPRPGHIALAEFSRLKGIAPEKVVEMIRDGFYVGQKVGDLWFVSVADVTGAGSRSTGRHATREEPMQYVPAKHLSQLKGIPEDKVIKMIRDGFYVGKVENGVWYLAAAELNNVQGVGASNPNGYTFSWWHLWIVLIVIKAIASSLR